MIEVGRLLRYLVLLGVTSMSSVLLSFRLRMFAPAQVLTSLKHDCIVDINGVTFVLLAN